MVEKARDLDPALVESLEKRGELAIRAEFGLNPRGYAGGTPIVPMWLSEKDAERQDKIDAREERMVEASERSAEAADKAALATKDAVRAAYLSAVIAFLALVVAVIALYLGR